MIRRALCLVALSSVLAVGTSLAGPARARGFETRVQVTITNLTRGEIFSPAVVATHTQKLEPLFVLGKPASSELRQVAEDAINGPLVNRLESDPAVMDVKTFAGPIMPGHSETVELDAGLFAHFVSLVGMLVTTNDGFYAVNGLRLPLHGTEVHYSNAYDAGTEANNEDCAFIPGPPCGHAGVRAEQGAEGYVYVHAGIHGVGDLDPAQFDWRNPVARIEIRRVR